jgi:hypothetical protein
MSRSYIPVALRQQVRREARFRCGYCLTPELYTGQQLVPDHLVPEALGGETVLDNLWLACRHCNEHKNQRMYALDPISNDEVSLFNPRTQLWSLHFVWSDDGTQIRGITAIGRATVAALQMNRKGLVVARSFWVQAGWHPPEE